jgi:hypothetical protein
VKEFREVPVYLDRPYEVIREVDRFVEYPVDRIVEVPVDRYVEVPVDRVVERIVEVPVDRIVEVPVEHIVDRIVETRDEREIMRMRDENDYEQWINYSRERIRNQDKYIVFNIQSTIVNLERELKVWRDRFG